MELKPLTLTPASVALMSAVVDDLCSGGTEALIANSEQWKKLGIPGIFMRGPWEQPRPRVIDDAFANAVWARRNRRH